jgi:dipeptidase E
VRCLLLGSWGIGALPALLDAPVADRRIAFVVTAANPDPESKFWVQVDRRQLEVLGCDVVTLDLATVRGDDLAHQLANVDVVFVTGGSTYQLLWHARRSGFADLAPPLVNEGRLVYVGTSAGAILAGPDIHPAAHPDGRASAPPMDSTDALGLVDFTVLPHHQNPDRRALNDAAAGECPGRRFVPLTDEEAVVVAGERCEIVPSPILA